MADSFTLWPLRFSPRPAAMIDFFTSLGLRQTLGDADQTYATFDGATGSLGVHGAANTETGTVPLRTTLNFATADLDAAASELRAAGSEVRVWDETHGKQGAVLTSTGSVIGLNHSTQEDLYGGYAVPQQDVASSLDVVVIGNTDDVARDVTFFAAFGYRVASTDATGAVRLRADGDVGILVLQPGQPSSSDSIHGDQFGPPYAVSLGFETSEPLDALAARLTGAGHPAQVLEGDSGSYVSLVDPDGEVLLIHLTR